jgi:hypothetical protein
MANHVGPLYGILSPSCSTLLKLYTEEKYLQSNPSDLLRVTGSHRRPQPAVHDPLRFYQEYPFRDLERPDDLKPIQGLTCGI